MDEYPYVTEFDKIPPELYEELRGATDIFYDNLHKYSCEVNDGQDLISNMNRDFKKAGIPLSIEGKYAKDDSSCTSDMRYVDLCITDIVYSGKLNLDIDDKTIFQGIKEGMFASSNDFRSRKYYNDTLKNRVNPYQTIAEYNQKIEYLQNKIDDIKQKLSKTKNYHKSIEIAEDLDDIIEALNNAEASVKAWKDYTRKNPNQEW